MSGFSVTSLSCSSDRQKGNRAGFISQETLETSCLLVMTWRREEVLLACRGWTPRMLRYTRHPCGAKNDPAQTSSVTLRTLANRRGLFASHGKKPRGRQSSGGQWLGDAVQEPGVFLPAPLVVAVAAARPQRMGRGRGTASPGPRQHLIGQTRHVTTSGCKGSCVSII